MTHRFKTLASALLVGAMVAIATPASAHTTVETTSIRDGSAMTAAPANFTITFTHEARVGAIKLIDARGTAVPLSFVAPSAAAKTLTIPLPRLSAGGYRLTWRVMAKDGHAMTGGLGFSIGAAPSSLPTAPSGAKRDMAGQDMTSMANMTIKSSIADGAVLATRPVSIRFDFGHPMKLTRLRLSTATGETVPVKFTAAATPSASAEATFAALAPDSYSLVWAADAGDHVMGATIRFTVR